MKLKIITLHLLRNQCEWRGSLITEEEKKDESVRVVHHRRHSGVSEIKSGLMLAGNREENSDKDLQFLKLQSLRWSDMNHN